MNIHVLVAALLALPRYSGDTSLSTADREAMLEPVAEAISRVTSRPEDAAALIADGYFETKFASAVLHGHCDELPAGQRCDHGRARGPYQIHGWCTGAWRYADGSFYGLVEATRCALSLLRAGKRDCASWEGGYARLAGHSHQCTSRDSAARLQLMRRVLVSWEGAKGVPAK